MVLLGPGPVQNAQPNYTDWPFPWTLLKLILRIADEKHSDFISQFHFKFFLLQSVMFGFQLPWNYSSALVRIVSSGKMIFHLFQRSFKMSQVDMENPDVFNSENWETDFEPCLVCILGRWTAEHSPVLFQAVIYIKIWVETVLGHLCRASGRSWRNQKKINNPYIYRIFINY